MAETASIQAKGSKLKVMPPNLYQAWPPGLQVALDGGAYADINYYDEQDINYPGTYKLKTTAAATLRIRNYKTIDEADSIIGETVVTGEEGTT